MENQKFKLTKMLLEALELPHNDSDVKKAILYWWSNNREKTLGGLKLTDIGLFAFKKAGIKEYYIPFEQPIRLTNQLYLWLDHFVDCPFYVTNNDITVFSEKMAVQLILFSGNIYKYGMAKSKSY